MIVCECWSTVTFGRVSDIEANTFILRQQSQIKISQLHSCVITVLSGCRLGRNAKLGRTKHPVRIGEVVKEAKVFEASISGVETIPLRVFDAHAQVALRI